jgi:hypothetical protein
MKQPEVQNPPLQTSDAAQAVPSDTVLHPVVLFAGWQLWHALLGFELPGA